MKLLTATILYKPGDLDFELATKPNSMDFLTRITPPSRRLAQYPAVPLQQLLVHSPYSHVDLVPILVRTPPG